MNKDLVTIKIWEVSRNLLQELSNMTGKKMVQVLAEALVMYKCNLGATLTEDEQSLQISAGVSSLNKG